MRTPEEIERARQRAADASYGDVESPMRLLANLKVGERNNELHVLRGPRRTKAKSDDQLVHGLRSTYTNYGCRCEPCKAVEREYARQKRLRKKGDRL